MTYQNYAREVIDEETEVKIASQFCTGYDCDEEQCRCEMEE